MRRFFLRLLCVVLVCSSADNAFAQALPDRRVGFTFLLLPTGARDEALGATGIASVGTASSMMFNPAGLAFVHRIDANYSYIDWYGRSRKHAACIAGSASKAGTFGVSLQNYGYGSGTTRDAKDNAVTAAWGASLSDRFALGAAGRLIRQPHSEGIYNVFAFDLGAYYATESRGAIFALGARNLSSRALGVPERIAAPTRLRAGVLIDLISAMGIQPFKHRLDVAVDLIRPFYPQSQTAMNTGVEYTNRTSLTPGYSLAVSLRAGHKSRSPVAFGFGFELTTPGGRGLALDYANRRFSRSVEDPEDTHIQRRAESLIVEPIPMPRCHAGNERGRPIRRSIGPSHSLEFRRP